MNETPPRELLTGRKLDYKRDLRVGFGDYVQAYDPAVVKNSFQPRTHGCIVLSPLNNTQGTMYMLSLRSGKVVKRDQYKVLPIPDEVIIYMNEMALRQRRRVEGDVELRLGDTVINDQPQERELVADLPEGQLPPVIDAGEAPLLDRDPIEFAQEHAGIAAEAAAEHDVAGVPVEVPADGAADENADAEQAVEVELNNEDDVQPEGAEVAAVEPAGQPAEVYNITVKSALERYGDKAEQSIMKELMQMEEKRVWTPVKRKDLRRLIKSLKGARIITSKMFLREKFLSSGEFEKLKARLVAGGHQQDRLLYKLNELSSPTVGTSSIFMVLALAAEEGRKVVTLDFPGAYLNSRMQRKVAMRLEPLLASMLLKKFPERYEATVRSDGSVVVVLDKALYGTVEAAKLWYELLRAKLEQQGFVCNEYDECVFNRSRDGVQCTICVYVDDLLITCEQETVIEELITAISVGFEAPTVHRGDVHSYLGMTITFNRTQRTVSLTMEKYIEDTLRMMEISSGAASPAAAYLFRVETGKQLDKGQKEKFHSQVAKLLYLAKRVRPDLLVSVCFLASRVQAADEHDWKKLHRVGKYLYSTKSRGLTLGASEILFRRILAFIDASFAVHFDGKSQTGACITLGRGMIYATSQKQKLVTKSSTEAELVALSDGANHVIWVRNFLEAQGYEMNAAVIHQDNQSTIAMVEAGKPTSQRTKHVGVRYFWVHDRVAAREIELKYLSTAQMVADLLTKPLHGELLRRLTEILLGVVALSSNLQGCVGSAVPDGESKKRKREETRENIFEPTQKRTAECSM